MYLPVDTRTNHGEAASREAEPEERLASLEKTIRTKWEQASVTWSYKAPSTGPQRHLEETEAS